MKQFIADQKVGGARDNGRTPMQWTAGEQAGFSSGTPWLKVNDNKATINVAAQEKDENSTLNYFKKMVQLRKTEKDILVYGKYTLLDAANPNVYAYLREGKNGKKILVLLNFTATAATANLSLDLSKSKLLLGNMSGFQSNAPLRPYEAVVLAL